MLQILTELLSYTRKLLPLLEIYNARRPVHVHDAVNEEFQQQVVEALQQSRKEMLELRSEIEMAQQRLRVIDEHSAAVQRELSRLGDQQRTMMIAIVIGAAFALGALIAAVVAAVHS